MKKLLSFLPPILVVVGLLVLWEIVGRVIQTPISILPIPSSVFTALIGNIDPLLTHTTQTVLETLIGFLIAAVLGFVVALLLDSSAIIRKTFYPLLIASQTIPLIALAPLLLIWFGFDMLPKIIIVVLFCFFPVAIATANGFAHVDRDYYILLDSMNASSLQKLVKLRIPSSLPSFFAGLKIAAAYAITGAMVGEYVGAENGLGVFIQTSSNAHAISLVFAIVFVATLLSMVLFGFVSLLQWVVLPWERK